MHQQGVSHRDIKVENILLKDSKFKIADFGSAETEDNFLDWTRVNKLQKDAKSLKISHAFEDFEKNTTLMYRPPEMIDKYLQYPVGFAADIWMLGCVLYVLCFARHPFQECGTLAITNGQFFMPPESDSVHISPELRKLIVVMLSVNPVKRPTVEQLLKIVDNLKKHQKKNNKEVIEFSLMEA